MIDSDAEELAGCLKSPYRDRVTVGRQRNYKLQACVYACVCMCVRVCMRVHVCVCVCSVRVLCVGRRGGGGLEG